MPGIVELLTGDAWITMPPAPLQYQGRELAREFFRTVAFRSGRSYRITVTRANGQPALVAYLRDRTAHIARADGVLVLTLSGDRISAITRFGAGVVPSFGLPLTLPD